jgi:hypothetical protein
MTAPAHGLVLWKVYYPKQKRAGGKASELHAAGATTDDAAAGVAAGDETSE